MAIKVTVKGRFVYNGKVFGSLEELPEPVREAYEKATAGAVGPAAATGAKVKVAFNGTEYDSVEAMPPEARRLYEDAIAAVRPGHLLGGAAGGPAAGAEPAVPVTAAPIEPGGAAPRSRALALAIGLALLFVILGYLLYLSAGAR